MADWAPIKDEASTSGVEPQAEQVPTPTAANLAEDFTTVKSMNPQEVIEYEKKLRKIVEQALKWYQRGRNMIAGDLPINEVTKQLIQEFKTEVKKAHKAVHKANWKAVWESIVNKDTTCIWDPDDDNPTDTGPPPELMVQEEEATRTDPTELMQSLEKPLMDEQTQMIGDLFYSETCMLEYQGHMSMLLAKLAKSLDPVSFMVVLKASAKLMHRIMLPDDLVANFQPIPIPQKETHNDMIVAKISPNPAELSHWDDEAVTLYLAATLVYYIQRAILGMSNMKTMAKKFWVKLTALCRCINGHKYVGGSATSKKCISQP